MKTNPREKIKDSVHTCRFPPFYFAVNKKKKQVFVKLIRFFSSLSFFANAIQVESSNASRIVLNRVVPQISGKFSCEVSADAPSFQTHIVSGELQVVGEY